MRNRELKWSKIQASKSFCNVIIIFLAILVALIASWMVARGSMTMLIFISGLILFALILCAQKWSAKISTLQKILLYLVITAGFIGDGLGFLIIPVGSIHIFPIRILMIIMWFIFVIQILVNHGKLNISHIKVNRYLQFFGIWVIYAILSVAWAASKSDAISNIIALFRYVSIIFFAIYYFRNTKDLKLFYSLWLAMLCGLIIVGIWEHFTGHHLPGYGIYEEMRASFMFYPTGVFYNPNDYSTFLALSFPFATTAFRYIKNVLIRLIGLSSAILALYLIIVTESRANIIAVLLEFTFLVLLLTNLRQKFKVMLLVPISLIMLCFFMPETGQNIYSQLMAQLGSFRTEAVIDTSSVAIRVNLVRNGIMFLYLTMGFGVGAGNANHWMANFAAYKTYEVLCLHNWWLEVLVNYGIIIFVGYVVVYICIVRNLWYVWHKTQDRMDRMIAEPLLLALIGFIFASMSPASVIGFSPQWFLFAFALVFINCWLKNSHMM
ncbi:MAG: hypothetical protein GX359_00865 [Clostridiales bacterium]|nr:hypothetical protein [Clostridiales bacterium]